MRVFSELAQEHGITLVYTTHDMEHALDYSDRMIALKTGKIFFDRPTAEVTRSDLKGVFDA